VVEDEKLEAKISLRDHPQHFLGTMNSDRLGCARHGSEIFILQPAGTERGR
jgi:hypothetical protein